MGKNAKRREVQVLLAGGSHERLAPALSVALELRTRFPRIAPAWVGSMLNGERILCKQHRIPILQSQVPSLDTNLKTIMVYLKESIRFVSIFGKHRPGAVVSFGGHDSLPVLVAASLRRVPYFIHEQNSIPSFANRFFARGARKVFLGMPLTNSNLSNNALITGTPVRTEVKSYGPEYYPVSFDRQKKTIFICSGSDSREQFNKSLIPHVTRWSKCNIQIIWQTGKRDFLSVKDSLSNCEGVFLYPTSNDRYPFFAVSRLVIGTSNASFLAEVAYFGLPCVMIPGADNYEWYNAGLVENQGWGVRITNDDESRTRIDSIVQNIINDQIVFEHMSQKALDNAPSNAAARITGAIMHELRI